MIEDIRTSRNDAIGLAYCYFTTNLYDIEAMLRIFIIQLVSQCRYLPSDLKSTVIAERDRPDGTRSTEFSDILISLFPYFKRTYLVIDGMHELQKLGLERGLDIIQTLLEQSFGDVSIAVFDRASRDPNRLLELVDISVRLLDVQPKPRTCAHMLSPRSKVRSSHTWKLISLNVNIDRSWRPLSSHAMGCKSGRFGPGKNADSMRTGSLPSTCSCIRSMS